MRLRPIPLSRRNSVIVAVIRSSVSGFISAFHQMEHGGYPDMSNITNRILPGHTIRVLIRVFDLPLLYRRVDYPAHAVVTVLASAARELGIDEARDLGPPPIAAFWPLFLVIEDF